MDTSAKESLGTNHKRPKRFRTVQGSCNPCLKRRVKCSLDRPRCKRCVKDDQECNYDKVNLKWGKMMRLDVGPSVTSSVAKAILSTKRASQTAGEIQFQVGQSELAITEKKEVGFVQGEVTFTENEQTFPQYEAQEGYDVIDEIDNTTDVIVTLPDHRYPPLIQLAPPDRQLVYFSAVLAPRLHALGTPLQEAGLSTIVSDPLLDKIVATLSSFHMVNNGASSAVRGTILDERSQCIKLFTGTLKQQQTDAMIHENLLNGCILLGILDGVINSENSSISTKHLFGARAIITKLVQTQPNFLFQKHNALTTRILSLFNTMDLAYCLLTGDKPFLPSGFWYVLAGQDCWFGNLATNDPFLSVLDKLTEICSLGSKVKLGQQVDLGVAAALHLDFERLSHLLWSPWLKFTSAFADIGLLYYYRVFLGLAVEDGLIQDVVRRFVDGILATTTNGPETGMLEHCLLLPLLTIGAHCEFEADRELINANVLKSLRYLSFKSTELMMEFLRGQWEGRGGGGKDWWEQFGGIGRLSFIF